MFLSLLLKRNKVMIVVIIYTNYNSLINQRNFKLIKHFTNMKYEIQNIKNTNKMRLRESLTKKLVVLALQNGRKLIHSRQGKCNPS